MELNNQQRRQLKALAHPLKTVVIIGIKGLIAQVHAEIDTALSHHELIKIKLPALTKQQKAQLLAEICERNKAIGLGIIGRVAIVYRQNLQRKNHIVLKT